MNQENNSLMTYNAQKLRKNMTKEERKLWYECLKKLPVTVNRQKVMGHYILDFYCAKAKIAIELDGSQHYEEAGKAKDTARDEYLKGRGIKVLRYSNRSINQEFRLVCEDVYKHLIGMIPPKDTSSVSLRLPPPGSPPGSRACAPPQGEGI